MSRFFPQADYAEDQALARTILTTHCLTRGATTGAIIGGGIFGAREAIQQRFRPSPVTPPELVRGAAQRFLRAAGTGTAMGTVLLAGATVGRMYGRGEVEWQDRSWRLLGNKGQVACDDFTYGGAVLGMGGYVVAGAGKMMGLGWRGPAGAAGLGSVAGTVAYMMWRYGIKSGEFEK